MTREEAELRCDELGVEHPDRGTHRWIPRERERGEWEVVRVALPEGMRRDPTSATTETKPEPQQADDPRPAYWRDVGGPYAG